MFWQVSRLLALTYMVMASKKTPLSSKISENYWAAYFHQASVGTYHNLQLLSSVTMKRESKKAVRIHFYNLVEGPVYYTSVLMLLTYIFYCLFVQATIVLMILLIFFLLLNMLQLLVLNYLITSVDDFSVFSLFKYCV